MLKKNRLYLILIFSFIPQNESNSRLNISDSTNETNQLGKECNETNSINEQEQEEKDANDEVIDLLTFLREENNLKTEEQAINDKIKNLFRKWKVWEEENYDNIISGFESVVEKLNLKEKKQFLNTYGGCYTYKEYLNRNINLQVKEALADLNHPWHKKAWCNVKTFFSNNLDKILIAALLLAVVTTCVIKLREAYQEYNFEKQQNAYLNKNNLDLQSQTSNLQNDLNNQKRQNEALKQQTIKQQEQIANLQMQHGYDKLTWKQSAAEHNALQEKFDNMQNQRDHETIDSISRKAVNEVERNVMSQLIKKDSEQLRNANLNIEALKQQTIKQQEQIAKLQRQHRYDKLTWEQMSAAEHDALQEKFNDMQIIKEYFEQHKNSLERRANHIESLKSYIKEILSLLPEEVAKIKRKRINDLLKSFDFDIKLNEGPDKEHYREIYKIRLREMTEGLKRCIK